MSRAVAQGSPLQNADLPPAQGTATLLPGPPADAGYQAVAQVGLVDLLHARTQPGDRSAEAAGSKVRVRVLFPIKGVGRDGGFIVDTGGTSCNEIVPLGRLGQRAFIAGRVVKDRNDRTIFVGERTTPAR